MSATAPPEQASWADIRRDFEDLGAVAAAFVDGYALSAYVPQEEEGE